MTKSELMGLGRIAKPSTYAIRSLIVSVFIIALALDVDLKLIVLALFCMKLLAELCALSILGFTSLVKKLDAYQQHFFEQER